MPASLNTSQFGPVIDAYSRAQAIEDGNLVDVSETARRDSPMTDISPPPLDRSVSLPAECRALIQSGALVAIATPAGARTASA